MPLSFWFDHFLEASVEILEKNSLVLWKKFWHQKDILKLTDLLVRADVAFETRLKIYFFLFSEKLLTFLLEIFFPKTLFLVYYF